MQFDQIINGINVCASYSEEEIEDYIKVIKEYNESSEIKRLKRLMSEEIDPLKKAQILEQIRLVKMGVDSSDK